MVNAYKSASVDLCNESMTSVVLYDLHFSVLILLLRKGKKMKLQTFAVAALASLSFSASATIVYDANVTSNVITGTGIANGGFTVDTSGGVELGLRARVRYPTPLNVTNSNGDGTYNQAAGGYGSLGTRAAWNFDWSINTGTAFVDAYSYVLGMDFDAGVGTNFQTFDPVNGVTFADHSFGDSSTGQSLGVEALNAGGYAALLESSSLVQNSWNYDFFDGGSFLFDPTVDGTYTIYLEAYRSQDLVARTSIDVIVGNGAQVPEPGTLALLGLGLAGLTLSRRRRT